MPPEPASVAAARRHVEGVLDRWQLSEISWNCLQLISELATNAVIHARTEFTVELSRDGNLLRVCVHDGSTAAPGVRHYGSDSTTGRGMRLVDSMSTCWGVERADDGKTIWFEIDTRTSASATTWDDGVEVDLDDLLDQLGVESDDDRSNGRNASTLRPTAGRRLPQLLAA